MRRAKAAKLIDEYFENLHTVLWSDFDLSRTDRREKAKQWFLDQMQAAGIIKAEEQIDR